MVPYPIQDDSVDNRCVVVNIDGLIMLERVVQPLEHRSGHFVYRGVADFLEPFDLPIVV